MPETLKGPVGAAIGAYLGASFGASIGLIAAWVFSLIQNPDVRGFILNQIVGVLGGGGVGAIIGGAVGSASPLALPDLSFLEGLGASAEDRPAIFQ